jgi:hypothetical protein
VNTEVDCEGGWRDGHVLAGGAVVHLAQWMERDTMKGGARP